MKKIKKTNKKAFGECSFPAWTIFLIKKTEVDKEAIPIAFVEETYESTAKNIYFEFSEATAMKTIANLQRMKDAMKKHISNHPFVKNVIGFMFVEIKSLSDFKDLVEDTEDKFKIKITHVARNLLFNPTTLETTRNILKIEIFFQKLSHVYMENMN